MNTRKYITARDLRARLGKVSAMTLWRWEHQPALAFPKPVYINGRKYYDLGELEEWERNRPAPTTSIGRTLVLAALVIYGPSILVPELEHYGRNTLITPGATLPPASTLILGALRHAGSPPYADRVLTGMTVCHRADDNRRTTEQTFKNGTEAGQPEFPAPLNGLAVRSNIPGCWNTLMRFRRGSQHTGFRRGSQHTGITWQGGSEAPA
jgi:predicted DNA-binding transcriptional regulator AlpA